jgi:hypothetical protein
MIGEIFCDAGLRNTEVFGELRFKGIDSSPACAAAQKISYSNAQRLARFDVIVAGEIGIRKDKNTWADRSVVRFIQLDWRACQQAAQLHFEKRQARREAGISGTAADARPAGFADGFDRE